MLKAVVFDDEYIVLKGLQAMIDWPSFGIELTGTASDGYSALELFRKVQPDIILTDIRMPGMDGLQLIEAVMKEAPNTYCIVFSGFNEFEYVRRAIELGVADYLDKPITIQSIEKAIRKMLVKTEEQKENLAIKQKWEESKQELLEKATLDLLLTGIESLPKWRSCFGPDVERLKGVTVLAYSGKFVWTNQEQVEAVAVKHGQEQWLALFHYEHPTHEWWEWLAYDVDLIDREAVAIGVGHTYSNLEQACASCKEAVRALRSARMLQTKGIVRFEELGEAMTTPKGLSEREEAIVLSIRSGNKAGLLEQIDYFIAWILKEKVDTEIIEREILKLIYMTLQTAQESGLDAKADEFHRRYMPHVEIREAAASGQLLPWFREQIEKIADLTMESRELTKHAAVEQARVYIEMNISRDLSLQEVAGHVGLNATYLSVLFKEVMGETYIKFLTRYRMEYAKILLAKGLKVNEASEKVGYHTYRHFSEVFKKHTGFTPGQYKDELGNPS
jgi:two-component system response regulator YesN